MLTAAARGFRPGASGRVGCGHCQPDSAPGCSLASVPFCWGQWPLGAACPPGGVQCSLKKCGVHFICKPSNGSGEWTPSWVEVLPSGRGWRQRTTAGRRGNDSTGLPSHSIDWPFHVNHSETTAKPCCARHLPFFKEPATWPRATCFGMEAVCGYTSHISCSQHPQRALCRHMPAACSGFLLRPEALAEL